MSGRSEHRYAGNLWRCFLKCKKIQLVGAVICIMFFAAPLAALLEQAGDPLLAIPNGRRLGLLGNTLQLGILTAAGCMVIGFFTAAAIYTGRLKNSILRWWFLLLAPVPQYIYALAWMELVRMAGQVWPELLGMQIYGLFPCVAVEIMAYLPLCTGLALLGLERQDASLIQAALVCRKGDCVLYRICLPQMFPWLICGAGCVFVLSAADFSIPSLFQYNVYAMELFSDFSAYGKAVNSLWLAMPLMLLILLVVWLTQSRLKQILLPVSYRKTVPLYLSRTTVSLMRAAVFLSVLQILIPLLTLAAGIGGWEQLTASVELSLEELWVSCRIGILAAVLAVVPASLTAGLLCDSKSSFWRIVFLFPLAMPSALVGVGWLTLLNGSIFHGVTSTLLFPALGCATRFLPLGMLVLMGICFGVDKKSLQAALLLQNNWWKAVAVVKIPVYAPGVWAAGFLVFLLTLGDVGVTLMTAPPGKEPFSIKIYNYLHYGASEMVSGFCMVIIVICLAVMLLMMRIVRGRKNGA